MGHLKRTDLAPFPTTQWSLINRVQVECDKLHRPALGEIIRRYMPALRLHLRADRRVDPHDAEELLQGFLASKLISQDILAQADRGKGRLRSFLLVSLHRYMIAEMRKRSAVKRCDRNVAPIDDYSDVPDASSEPSARFHRAWARQVLAEATERMKAECESAGRPEVWAIFDARVLAPAEGRADAASYDQLVSQFSLASPAQASNLLVTAKRTFTRTLREVVGQYVDDESEIDQEIRELRDALRGHGP